MQIGEKGIENLFILNMVLEKKKKKKHRFEKIPFHACLFTWELAKDVLVWKCSSDDLQLI